MNGGLKQGIKSEIKKVGDPNRNGSLIRTSYYTKVNFIVENKSTDIIMKLDTGAAHTVIGLNNEVIVRYADMIKAQNINGKAYDASGTELKLNGFVVSDFRLTDDIVLPKIKIWFSEQLGEKAVLGMDILSIFDFQYQREKGSTNGTFYINNYEDTLNTLNSRTLNHDLGYIDPDLILIMDGKSENAESNINANCIHKIIL